VIRKLQEDGAVGNISTHSLLELSLLYSETDSLHTDWRLQHKNIHSSSGIVDINSKQTMQRIQSVNAFNSSGDYSALLPFYRTAATVVRQSYGQSVLASIPI